MKKLSSKVVAYKTPLIFALSSVFKAFASILVSFIVARFIAPSDLGMWTAVSLIATYAIFLQGGVMNGLNLELPFALGQNNVIKGRKLAAVAQTFILFVCLLTVIIGVSFYFLHPLYEEKLKWSILVITFIIALTFYQSYLLSTFRSNDSFNKLSYIQIADAIFNVLTLIFIVYFSYFGMLFKAVAVLLLNVVLLHRYRPLKVSLKWHYKSFLHLSKVGLPIFALYLAETFASSTDKVWLLHYSNLENVGLYSFSLYALTMITLLSASVATYMYPRMTFNYAQNKDKNILWVYIKKISVLLLIVLFPIVVCGYLTLPFLVARFFPEYTQSIVPLKILLIAGFFKGCNVGVNVLWSMKRWKLMFAYQIFYSFLLIVLPYSFFRFYSSTIEGLAIGVLIANFLNLGSGLYFSYISTNE